MDEQSETPGPRASGIEPAGHIPSRSDLVATIGSDTSPFSRGKSASVKYESARPTLSKSSSVDSAGDEASKQESAFARCSFKRRSIRRRSSKRCERPEITYGTNAADYDAIRERVFEERAVVNAIEALQERWRMLTFMYDDCVELNEGRKERRLRKLCIKRQMELIVIIAVFLLMCVPVAIILIFFCRLRL